MAEIFNVADIHCQSCVKRITKAIQEVQPGAAVTIDIEGGKVTVEPAFNSAVIAAAIEEAGYKVLAAA
jgi:copper chaperone CopZ